MNVERLRSKLAEQNMNIEALATAIGVNQSTLYRKINGVSDFTRNEIMLIRGALQLTAGEVDAIFFDA